MTPETVTKQVLTALKGIDPGLALIQPTAMDVVVAQALSQAGLMMTLLGVFAVVALLLAPFGIYGAVAYTVEKRTGEIGVRMALGAQTADVLRLVLKQGMTPVVFELVAGIAAALALGRLLNRSFTKSRRTIPCCSARLPPVWASRRCPRACSRHGKQRC